MQLILFPFQLVGAILQGIWKGLTGRGSYPGKNMFKGHDRRVRAQKAREARIRRALNRRH